MSGSQFGIVVRYFWAIKEPKGTPISPASIAQIPNWYETLDFYGLRTGGRVKKKFLVALEKKKKRGYLLILGDIFVAGLHFETEEHVFGSPPGEGSGNECHAGEAAR